MGPAQSQKRKEEGGAGGAGGAPPAAAGSEEGGGRGKHGASGTRRPPPATSQHGTRASLEGPQKRICLRASGSEHRPADTLISSRGATQGASRHTRQLGPGSGPRERRGRKRRGFKRLKSHFIAAAAGTRPRAHACADTQERLPALLSLHGPTGDTRHPTRTPRAPLSSHSRLSTCAR